MSSYDPETGLWNTEGTPDLLWNANATDWTKQVSAAPASANLLTPEDWYQWGKGQPGYFGRYTDPATGAQRNTPAPPSLVPGGYSQQYNPATGRWDVSNDSIGGLFGWIEENPYLFAALAATAAIGGPVLAGAAPAAGAGEGAAGLGGLGATEMVGPAALETGGGGLFGTGVTGTQALQAASLANSATNVARNPSGTSAGSFLGAAAGAATGVPALGLAGTLAGGTADATLRGGSGDDLLQDSGGPRMAEDGSGTSGLDWVNALGPLLTSGIGLTGSALSLAALPQILGRLETLYNQNQGNYQQRQQIAQTYQQVLNFYQQQQQQAYAQTTGETAADRAARQQAYQARVGETAQDRQARIKAFEDQSAQRTQDRATRDAAFQRQTGETAIDRANLTQANQGRAGVAGRLSDPAQVAAGAQQIYQPMSQGMTDNLLRGVQRDLAMRGQSDGGAASRATADAMAPYYNQLQQQAMQNFLASQGQALSAYNPLTGSYSPSAPQGPYTPDAPQGPYTPDAPFGLYTGQPPQPPRPADIPDAPTFVPGSNAGPQANQAGAYQGLSNQVAQLGKLLFGNQANSPGAIALLTKLFGGGGGQNPALDSSTDQLGQQYNTDFMNSFGQQGGGSSFDPSSLDSSYFDNTLDTSYGF